MFTTTKLSPRDEAQLPKVRAYRLALVTEARTLVNQAETETRALTPAEHLTFDELRAEIERVDVVRRDLETSTPRLQDEVRALIARGGSAPASLETRAWLPSFSEYAEALETRAVPPQNEANGADGGYIVPTQTVSQIFDRLRAQAVFLAAQPFVVTMTSMTAMLPIIGTSVTVSMVAENSPVPMSGLTLRATTLRARKAAALTLGSNEWFSDSNPSARQVLGLDLERTMAGKIDEQALVGDGTGENVLGLFNVAGIADTPVGGPLTLDAVLGALAAVEGRGAMPTAIFLNPAGWTALVGAKDTGNAYLLNPVPSEAVARRLFGVPVFTSPFVPAAQALVAAMPHVAFGWREQIRISYDQGGQFFVADQTAVRAIARFDVAVLNIGAVQKLSGITATFEARETPGPDVEPMPGRGGLADEARRDDRLAGERGGLADDPRREDRSHGGGGVGSSAAPKRR